MAKYNIFATLDYIRGYLKYGHFEGDIEIPKEDIKEFENHPINYILNHHLTDYLNLQIDDFEIEDYGNINEVDFTRKG